ncbi:Sensor domain-containing diguanylate cyclase [Vibrio neptunius]|uniref:transporter substrate-binding domain-containing diguanylate cyclase n=1 Tax=Vibrio neptunius TaxID=170651 RepID=UPI00214E1C8C|nr:sensor domain-containing diguanylate cyclase [Vibrio neptunius]
MLRVFAAWCMLIFLTNFANGSEKQTLIVTNSKAWKPFSYIDEDGKAAGILVDYWNEYGLKNHKNIEFLLLDWNDSILAVRSGRADVHSGLLWSATREAFLDYNASIMPIDTQLYISSRLIGMDVNSFLLGNHHHLTGVIKGAYEEEFTRLHFPSLQIVAYRNNEEMIEAAFAGEIEAFVADLQVANFYLHTADRQNTFIGIKHLYSGYLRPAVAEGNDDLNYQLSQGLNQISNEEKKRIFGRWMYINTVYPDYLWPLAAVAILLTVVAYIVSLRFSVNAKTRELAKANKELRVLSETDPLTQLSNRRHFVEEFQQRLVVPESLAVMIFDIDDFKIINDNFGHQVGDRVIQQVAEAVRTVIKNEHLFGRIGGEEFALVVSGHSLGQITTIAHKVCYSVRSVAIEDKAITVSLGCAYYPLTSFNITLSDADQLMYRAKALGKDRAVIQQINVQGNIEQKVVNCD